MTHEKDSEAKFAGLRSRAEENLGRKASDVEELSALSPQEITRLVQELRVHEIELEMQNEDLRRAQIESEELKDRYLELYDFAPVGYVTLNEKGLILGANLTVCRLLGVERQSLMKMYFSRIVCPEFGDAFYVHLRQVFETQSKQTCEIKLSRKDGTHFFAQLESRALEDDTGQFRECRTVVFDITDRKRAEKALRRAKQDWEDIFQSIGHPTIVMDVQHGIVDANKAAIDASGRSLNEMLNAKCYHLFHESNEPPQGCPAEAVLESGSSETVEMEMEALGRYYLISCTPILGEEGNIQKIIHIATDITERRRAEEALRESETRFRATFEQAAVGVAHVAPDGRWLRVNQKLCDIVGYSCEELLTKTFQDITYPADLQTDLDYVSRVLTDQIKTYSIPKRYIRKDGSLVWIDLTMSLVRNAAGAPDYFISVVEDITERRCAEEVQRESDIRYRTLFNESMDGIFVTSRDGVLLDANPAFLRLFGYKGEDFLGRDIRETYVNPSDRDRFVKAIEAAGALQDYPLLLQRSDGKQLHCLLTSHVRRAADGTILGYQGILRDITEQRDLQKQLLQAQKMEAIGTLAGGVSHDFNNILQVVLGYSELALGDEELGQRHRADLQKINEAAKRGAELVQRLLTFGRKAEINPQPLNLNRRITELRKMIERTIPKMIDIQLILAEDLATINADPTQVDQVLMNLAVNARDAMPDGGTLTVETANVIFDEEYARAHLEAKPGHHVLLMITDTGSGMDQETLEHIFEPFYTTKGVGEGTGLGLAMVHGIVQQHGGHVRCYSEQGHGTTFKIYFPSVEPYEEPEDTAVRKMPRGGHETILLVDDEELIRDLGFRILTRAGYQAIAASNGKEALEIFRQRGNEIALVLLDLMMPEMGGKQCLENLVNLDPSVKVVIASGLSAYGQTKEVLALGAKGFVNKPYELRQVLEVVREVLDAQ